MSLSQAWDAWALVVIVLSAVLGSEALSYVTVYRRSEYKHACKRVTELTKKFEKEDAKLVPVDKRKAHEKNVARIEEEVKEATTKMTGIKFKSNFLSSVFFFILYRYVASSYSGHVVARLPFEPWSLVSGFVSRGLKVEDTRACGFGFVYSLATMALKATVPKLLGFSPPRSAYDPTKAAARAAAKASDAY